MSSKSRNRRRKDREASRLAEAMARLEAANEGVQRAAKSKLQEDYERLGVDPDGPYSYGLTRAQLGHWQSYLQDSPVMPRDTGFWLVAVVPPQKEFIAVLQLRQLEVTAKVLFEEGERHVNRTRLKIRPIYRPRFPQLVFVHGESLDVLKDKLERATLVRSLLVPPPGKRGRHLIDPETFWRFADSLDAESAIMPEEDPLEAGDEVRLIEGPLSGFPGIVDSYAGGVAKIALMIFGRETLIEVSVKSLRLT